MEPSSGADRFSPQGSTNPAFVVDAAQYARRNNLTVDNSQLDWRKLVGHDPAITSTIAGLDPGQLLEHVQLQECLFRPIIPTTEQWQLPAPSLQILQQVCRRSDEGEVADWLSQNCLAETAQSKSLKLEAPALRSDHGIDCRLLARRVEVFSKESLPDHRLPLHPVDLEKGEGLEFPQSMMQKDAEHMQAVGREHLEVTKDTLVYVMQTLKTDLTGNELSGLLESVSAYRGVGAREHLTPPLSPLTEAFPAYFTPGDDSCELPAPSQPSSRLSENIEAAENKIFEPEFTFWADVLEKDRSPARYNSADVSEMIRAGEFRTETASASSQPVPRDMKLDVPLLPCSENGIVPEVVRVLAPDDMAEANELVVSSDSSGSDGPTGQLVSLFKKSATTVMRQAEQEKLQPLDATARATVPIMDFSIPVPEWEQRIWDTKAMFRWIQKNIDVDWQGVKWTHNRAAEQRMVWAPLAHMREKKLVSEEIEAKTELIEVFLNRPGDDEVLTSADYVYKEQGLAVLRVSDEEDEDEDCLTPSISPEKPSSSTDNASGARASGSMTESPTALQRSSLPSSETTATSPPADLTVLLAGRKRLIDEALHKRQPENNQARAFSCNTDAAELINSALIPSTNILMGYTSEYTNFAPLVDNFVEMNFPRKPKLSHSSFFPPSGSATPSLPLSKAEMAAKLMPPPPKPIPALAPELTAPDIPPRIVVSSTISSVIAQYLTHALPGIELVSRNYDKHRPPGWSPGTRTPNLDEADIIVSPATGILLTTMINLRQRVLPQRSTNNSRSDSNNHNDNNAHPTFHRVVRNVAARHERLVVLVSEGNKRNETVSPLSQSDARALAELQGFAAGLQATTADVQVVYIGGGAETLARWVAFVVCRYAREAEAEAVREVLLPVETSWEVFLRRAGMNVYAAQVVLGKLPVPDGRPAVGGEDGQVFGLPLFVTIPRERRVELFEGLLGGRRVLDRVSEAIDQRWEAPAVGVEGSSLGMVRTW